jgi:diaminopimelate epimerase
MRDPVDFRVNQLLTVADVRMRFHYVNSGSPHCIIFLDENKEVLPALAEIDVDSLGRKIRNHFYFSPEGTNVNFVDQLSPNILSIRTYERGVEAETLACGTGSVAVGLLASKMKNLHSPISLRVKSGEVLMVEFLRSGDVLYKDVSLRGSAHIVFSGVVKYEFSSQSILDIV